MNYNLDISQNRIGMMKNDAKNVYIQMFCILEFTITLILFMFNFLKHLYTKIAKTRASDGVDIFSDAHRVLGAMTWRVLCKLIWFHPVKAVFSVSCCCDKSRYKEIRLLWLNIDNRVQTWKGIWKEDKSYESAK